MPDIHIHISINNRTVYQIYAALLILGAVFLFATIARATTPDPGHAWASVGNGFWQASNSQTQMRTFTFPDADETVLTTAGAPLSGTVPYGNGTGVLATTTAGTAGFVLGLLNSIPTWVATTTLATITGTLPETKGGTNQATYTTGDILYASGANTLSRLAIDTAGFVLALSNGMPAWVATTTLANISGTLGLTGGGTNASLTANNGGIVWSNASQFQVLAGTATAGQVLRSGATAAPTWSTATYPATAGTSGQELMSNGTNWTTATTSATVSTFPKTSTTGVLLSTALAGSLTARKVGLFTIPKSIVVKQVSLNVPVWSVAGTLKICIYDKYGANKLIDVTTASIGATGVVNTAVASVVLPPDDYYIAVGCQSGTCTMSLSFFTTPSTPGQNAATVPAGKLVYEGTVAHTSGTCNATLGTITAAVSNTVVARLDN